MHIEKIEFLKSVYNSFSFPKKSLPSVAFAGRSNVGKSSLINRLLNKKDIAPGRKIWYQYWDTCLTYERSYIARLNYVHNNPAKHGLINNSENYKWCSMAWFINNANPGFRKSVLSLKYDGIRIEDNF